MLVSKISLKVVGMSVWTLLDSIEVSTLFSFFAALAAIFLCAWCWNRIPIPLFGSFHRVRMPGKAFFSNISQMFWPIEQIRQIHCEVFGIFSEALLHTFCYCSSQKKLDPEGMCKSHYGNRAMAMFTS